MRRRDAVGRVVLALVAVGIIVAAVGFAVGLAVPEASTPFSDVGADGEASDDGAPAHVNPGNAGEDSALGGIQERLLTDFAGQVESGAINLTQENYEQARDQLGDDQFDELVSEYQEISSNTNESQARRLQASQIAVANYTEHVAAYWELYTTYEQLTDTEAGLLTGPQQGSSQPNLAYGDGPEAVRSIAAQIDDRATVIQQLSETTVDRYQELADVSDRNYAETITAINASRDNVTATRETVVREQYIQTDLTLTVTDAGTISAQQPLKTSGRLTTELGPPLANETVSLEVGAQTIPVETNATGWFDLQYHPTMVTQNTTTLTVASVRESGARWIGDEATVDVRVEATRPTLQVDLNRTEVSYNESVTVTGSLTAQEEPLRNVSYSVSVAGQFVAQNVTTPDGRLDTEFRLPATVEAGQQQIRVQLLTEGRALVPVDGTASFATATSETVLTVDETETNTETVRVAGKLGTEAGNPVSNQSILLRVDGQTVDAGRTVADGSFRRTIAIPERSLGNETATLTVAFNGTGTNLASASGQTQFTVPRTRSVLDLGLVTDVGPAGVGALLIGGLLVGGVGYLLVRLRRRSSPTGYESDDAMPSPPTASVDVEQTASWASRTVDHLESDRPAAAIRSGYATVRMLLDDGQRNQELTHWEFYHHNQDQLGEETDTLLRRATEHYEHVEFAAESADETMAQDVLAAVQAFGDGVLDEHLTDGDTLDRATTESDD